MRLIAGFGVLLSLLLAAAAGPGQARPRQSLAASVEVVRNGPVWTAEYRFAVAAPAWAFVHSGIKARDQRPWREGSWVVETEGVRLERHGRYDVLVAQRGNVPLRVRLRFEPVQADVQGGYSPSLLFSGRAVALFTDQFDVVPLTSPASARDLPVDPDDVSQRAAATRVRFLDRAGALLHGGVRKRDLTTIKGQSYVLFGSARLIQSRAIATVIDPALPAWLSDELGSSTSRLLAYYTRLLGPRRGPKPVLMATWAGPTANIVSMNGGVLPGMVVMSFEGARVRQFDPAMRGHVRWFVAHESAHFWLGESVAYDVGSHAWMMEGGADLLAVRALAAMDPNYDPDTKLAEAVSKCGRFTRGHGVNSANRRDEHDAYYACGTVFGLIAEAAANKRQLGLGFGGFWRGLIAANRSDRIVTQDEWLAALTRISGDPSLARDIRRLAEKGAADPEGEIASLFRRAGVRLGARGIS